MKDHKDKSPDGIPYIHFAFSLWRRPRALCRGWKPVLLLTALLTPIEPV